MQLPTQEEREEVAKAIELLMKSPQRPDISVIGPLARKLRIQSARELWDFFEKVVRQWVDHRSYDSDWDTP